MAISTILKMASKRKLDCLHSKPPAKIQKPQANARNFHGQLEMTSSDMILYQCHVKFVSKHNIHVQTFSLLDIQS